MFACVNYATKYLEANSLKDEDDCTVANDFETWYTLGAVDRSK